MPPTTAKLFSIYNHPADSLANLRALSPQSPHITIGTDLSDPSTIHITHALDVTPDLESPPTLSQIQTVAFDTSPFGPDSPATAPLIEYVQVYFPVSRATPAYQAKIESDFARVNAHWKTVMKGDIGLAQGWQEEEVEHADLGEKAKCFWVMRGWEGTGVFEAFTQTDEYKSAMPVIVEWGVPHRLWHAVTI